MKRLLILLVLSLAVIATVQAQWKFSLVAGPSLANFNGSDKKDWGGTNTDPKMVVRFQFGLIGERIIAEKWFVGGGLQFSTKGASYEGTTDYYDLATSSFQMISVKYNKVLSYIDVPIYAKYVASQKLFLVIGIQPSILVGAKIKNDENAQKAFSLPEKEDAKDYYGTFDFGLLLGPQYEINEKMSLRLLYKPGLLKIAKDEVYSSGGNTEEQYYKVMNSVLDLSFIYRISQ
ncbi:MAG: porin family protein [Cytophagales bacterium]|nr:porin family protein [Cytophagales bacterium]